MTYIGVSIKELTLAQRLFCTLPPPATGPLDNVLISKTSLYRTLYSSTHTLPTWNQWDTCTSTQGLSMCLYKYMYLVFCPKVHVLHIININSSRIALHTSCTTAYATMYMDRYNKYVCVCVCVSVACVWLHS